MGINQLALVKKCHKSIAFLQKSNPSLFDLIRPRKTLHKREARISVVLNQLSKRNAPTGSTSPYKSRSHKILSTNDDLKGLPKHSGFGKHELGFIFIMQRILN